MKAAICDPMLMLLVGYNNYVDSENIEGLKKIPGIGPKMAKKIIFDLKGVIPSDNNNTEQELNNIEKDLIGAMINLGYKESDIKEKLKLIQPISDDFEKEFKRMIKFFM